MLTLKCMVFKVLFILFSVEISRFLAWSFRDLTGDVESSKTPDPTSGISRVRVCHAVIFVFFLFWGGGGVTKLIVAFSCYQHCVVWIGWVLLSFFNGRGYCSLYASDKLSPHFLLSLLVRWLRLRRNNLSVTLEATLN